MYRGVWGGLLILLIMCRDAYAPWTADEKFWFSSILQSSSDESNDYAELPRCSAARIEDPDRWRNFLGVLKEEPATFNEGKWEASIVWWRYFRNKVYYLLCLFQVIIIDRAPKLKIDHITELHYISKNWHPSRSSFIRAIVMSFRTLKAIKMRKPMSFRARRNSIWFESYELLNYYVIASPV